ncbi:o-acyltransferase [Anaeramoeba flamelloides]|uniref:O-acyltransferase n=1 Tax=Anaeramoeba flamelloides TaxID=1746091 RepID=A0ABQ8XNA4_9EUKA|nr:o-acyltransferase [Anaeramoeba flamelloides]
MILHLGDNAVDSFFVLSGFLCYRKLLFFSEKEDQEEKEEKEEKETNEKKHTFSSFKFAKGLLIRRYLRLYPLIYVLSFLKILELLPQKKLIESIPAFLLCYFGLNDLHISINPPVGQSWSSAVELKSYAILILFRRWLFKKKNQLRNLLILLTTSLVVLFAVVLSVKTILDYNVPYKLFDEEYYNFLQYDPETKELNIKMEMTEEVKIIIRNTLASYYGFHIRFPNILAGCLLAYVQYKTDLAQRLKSNFLLKTILYLFGLFSFLFVYVFKYTGWFIDYVPQANQEIGVLYYTLYRLIYFNRFLSSVGFAILLFMIINKISIIDTIISKFLSSSIWVPFSKLSYSVYLAQITTVFLGILQFRGTIGNEIIQLNQFFKFLMQSVITTYIASLVLYIFVERPFCILSPRVTGTSDQKNANLEKKDFTKEKKVK